MAIIIVAKTRKTQDFSPLRSLSSSFLVASKQTLTPQEFRSSVHFGLQVSPRKDQAVHWKDSSSGAAFFAAHRSTHGSAEL